MAYTFNGSNQYLRCASNPLGTGQLGDHSIAFFAKAVAASPRTTVIAICRSTDSGGVNNPAIIIQNENGAVFYFLRANSSPDGGGWNGPFAGSALIGGTAFNNSWNHVCCTLSGFTSTIYVNGAIATTGNAPGGSVPAQTDMDCLSIAAIVRTTAVAHAACNVAAVGVWGVALASAEIASLAKGIACDRIRPESLVFYAPLVRGLVDTVGGLTITNNNGATVADHPRIYN